MVPNSTLLLHRWLRQRFTLDKLPAHRSCAKTAVETASFCTTFTLSAFVCFLIAQVWVTVFGMSSSRTALLSFCQLSVRA